MKQVVFTDLDGTLLDSQTYSHDKCEPAVELLKKLQIPVVFCSAKTRAEQEFYRRELGLFHPFIVENGGAIFIPEGYFPFQFDHHRVVDKLEVIELAISHERTKALLNKIKKENGFSFRGLTDMTAAEIANATGLSLELAELAKQREYSETIRFDCTDNEVANALKKMQEIGLECHRGERFYHVTMGANKGKAVAVLIGLYRQMWREIKTIGIGNAFNDVPMLSNVEVPVLVQKNDCVWEDVRLPRLRKVPGIGPEGWNTAIMEMLAELNCFAPEVHPR